MVVRTEHRGDVTVLFEGRVAGDVTMMIVAAKAGGTCGEGATRRAADIDIFSAIIT